MSVRHVASSLMTGSGTRLQMVSIDRTPGIENTLRHPAHLRSGAAGIQVIDRRIVRVLVDRVVFFSKLSVLYL